METIFNQSSASRRASDITVADKAREVKPMLFEDNDSVSQMLALPVAAFVQAVYGKLLGRLPDTLELKSNIGAIRCGLGRVHFMENVHNSYEFRTRTQKILNDGSDSAFIAREFSMYLGRKPDPQGLEHYLDLLEKGISRKLIHRDISKSKEAKRSYTFWYELDRVLCDYRNSAHPIKRWIGRNRREERKKNQKFEIINNERIPFLESHVKSLDESIDHKEFNNNYGTFSRRSIQSSLIAVERGNLNGGAKKVLSRLQHASGISSSNRNNS